MYSIILTLDGPMLRWIRSSNDCFIQLGFRPPPPPSSKLAPGARRQSSSVATRYSADNSHSRAAFIKALQHEAPPGAPAFSAQTWLGLPWVAALLDIEMDTQAPDAEKGLAKALRFGHTFTGHKGLNRPRHIRRLQSEPTEPPKTGLNGKNTNLNGEPKTGTYGPIPPNWNPVSRRIGQHPKSDIQHPTAISTAPRNSDTRAHTADTTARPIPHAPVEAVPRRRAPLPTVRHASPNTHSPKQSQALAQTLPLRIRKRAEAVDREPCNSRSRRRKPKGRPA